MVERPKDILSRFTVPAGPDGWPSAARGWVLIGLLCGGLGLLAGGGQALQFDRAAIAAGEWWRVLTGNFVHYGWWHLVVNVGAFLLLSWIAAGRSRGIGGVVLAAAVAVGLGLYWIGPDVQVYRGISGVDYALLMFVLLTSARMDTGGKRVLWLAAAVGVAAKTAFETAAGRLLLPTSAPADVAVVGLSHVMGLIAGSAAAGLREFGARRARRRLCRRAMAGHPRPLAADLLVEKNRVRPVADPGAWRRPGEAATRPGTGGTRPGVPRPRPGWRR